MEKSKKVMVLSSIVLVGFVIAVIFHYILGYYLKSAYPYNTFLGDPNTYFTDFTDILLSIKDFAPFKNVDPWINYFPLAYILLFPFTFIKNKFISYFIFASISLSFLLSANIKNFSCKNLSKLQNFQNIFILSFMSYPILCALDRGNLDLLLFIIFAAFVYLFKKEKYLSSACLLAIINAIKPFPLLFLFLFLFKKRYKEFFFSIIISTILIVGGFMLLNGSFFNQVSTFIINLENLKIYYVYNNDNNFGMFNGTSLYMALKLLFTRLSFHPVISTILLAKIYGYLIFFINIITLFFTFKEKSYWKQISLLSLNMLLTPYIVNDYKLLFLFIPLWLFINSKETSKHDLAYTILFGLLFIPKNLKISYLMTGIGFSPSIILNPLIMIIISGLIIAEQIQVKKNKEENIEH